ncbi:MAG: hypothetical protein HQ552_08365 [Desulfobacteraceae bacterium]|nr:hypothetical protein [Desulfobacteraceae bacterium]
MRYRYVLPVLIVAWLLSPVYAEFYRYTGENGAVLYTDNIADVPESQREKIDRYNEPKDFLTPEELADKAKRETRLQESDRKASQDAKERKNTATGQVLNQSLVEEFNRIDTELSKEYSDLMKERTILEKGKTDLKTAKQINAYRKKVTDFNRRIADYEKRRKELQERIDAY